MFSSDKWFGASAEFYSETIDQSLRFDGSSSELNITPSSTGNRRTFTTSLWVKRSKISSSMEFFTGGSNSYNTASTQFGINSSDQLQFYDVLAGITNYAYVRSDNLLRDTSNWYHIVLAVDTTQSTASDRVKLYINGSEVSYVSSPTYPSQNHQTVRNNSGTLTRIGRFPNVAVNFFSGYMAEFNHIDGTALDPTSFGETKNGVWIPKEISGLTYGTNGFRLTFANSSALGDDTSGNGNDFTSSGLDATDVVLDSPTNNFCVINSMREPTVYNGSVTFSEGNLQSVDAGTTYSLHWTATFGMSTGKWYWEVLAHTMGGSHSNIGICNEVHKVGTAGTGVFYNNTGKRNAVTYFTGTTTYGDSYTNGDIIGIAFDADNETVTFYKNNSSQGAVGSVLVQSSGPYFAAAGDGQNATTYKYVVNFGQDSSFAGNKTAQGNTDDNGVGDFYYSPPSGYLALCSSNLPDTTLSPNQSEQADDHFNTITYTGDDASSRSLTGVGFRPDWIWYKHRSIGYGHVMYDSSRGTGENHLRPDNTIAEGDYNDLYGTLTSFDADGITIARGDASGTESAFFNTNGATVVGWNWKANGGTTSSNTDGTITSTVQVNTTAGFSIVLFTGDGNANATVGHGLGVKPGWYVVKDRSSNSAGHWMVWHQGFSDVDNNLFLNLTNAVNNGGFGTGDPTTTTTFEPAVTTYNNVNGNNYVAYVFAEVEGYSKFGSFVGSGSADGVYINLGFRPRMIIFKDISTSSESWYIVDTARDTHNPVTKLLFPNDASAEYDSSPSYPTDFLSNGFKIRNASFPNTSGRTYIYMAWGDGQTAKFSNAR